MSLIRWKMTYDTAEKYLRIARRKENYEISEEEFAEQITTLPGYPLSRPPLAGDNITIEVQRRVIAPVPGTIH